MADDPSGAEELAQLRYPTERALAVLLRMAAHDLRTPLNAMAGWLQVLAGISDPASPTRERALKGIHLAVTQQTMLADGLSQISGLQGGTLRSEVAPTDMARALQDATAWLSEEAKSRAVALNAIEPVAGVELMTDGSLMQALLRHLLAGSLKFASKNSQLNVRVDALPMGESCTVRIEFERALVTAQELDMLLRYASGGPGEQPKGAGAAFGLAVAAHMARYLGGGLEVSAGGDTAPGLFLKAQLRSGSP